MPDKEQTGRLHEYMHGGGKWFDAGKLSRLIASKTGDMKDLLDAAMDSDYPDLPVHSSVHDEMGM